MALKHLIIAITVKSIAIRFTFGRSILSFVTKLNFFKSFPFVGNQSSVCPQKPKFSPSLLKKSIKFIANVLLLSAIAKEVEKELVIRLLDN